MRSGSRLPVYGKPTGPHQNPRFGIIRPVLARIPGMTRAAIYLRVSTTNQSTENQRPAVLRLAEGRGLEVVEVYEEKVSALAKERAAWTRLKKDAHAGKFRAVVINSLDRLGRSMSGNIQDLLLLERLGVQVISVRESWRDLGGPTRDLLVAVLSWVAQEEARTIRARVQAGLDRARREGKQLGRPKKQILLQRALDLRTQGKSLRVAARELSCGVSTLHRLYAAHDLLDGRSEILSI
jgi:putative DNA-invertase from lambdoid prophage Rac